MEYAHAQRMIGTCTSVLAREGLDAELHGPWAVVGQAPCQHGWKLRVSSVPVESRRLLQTVVPLLAARGVSFKVAKDDSTLSLLNEGAHGATQIGKFMTIYPVDAADARALAVDLIERTQGFHGPIITTDLRLGDVLYARYGAFDPRLERHRLGQIALTLQYADGLEPAPVSTPIAADQPNPFADLVRPTPMVTPHPTRLFGPGYRLLEFLKQSAKGSVLLALDMRSPEQLGLRVIKEGRQHCWSDRHGRDMRSRLRHQETLHRALVGRLPIARVEPYFEVDGHGYLPMAFVDGWDLSHVDAAPFSARSGDDQRRWLDRLAHTARAVSALHAAGVVHRDLVPSNLRVGSDDVVTLLDLELAHVLGTVEPPYGQGTPGFVSPQQEARHSPEPSDDVFSFGAILILITTGLDPRRVLFAGVRGRAQRIGRLSGTSRAVTDLVAACVNPVAASRPTMLEVERELTRLSQDAESVAPVRTTGGRSLRVERVRSRARAALVGAAEGLRTSMLRNPQGLWLSPSLHVRAQRGVEVPSGYALYRSASRGVAGGVYALARLAQADVGRAEAARVIRPAVDWLLARAPTDDDQLTGLHFGEAGVAVAIAEAVRADAIDKGAWLTTYLADSLKGPADWPDVTHGAAGLGLAALLCADAQKDPSLLAWARPAADALVSAQDSDGGWTLPRLVEGLGGVRYTGFAHGTAGIAYFLIEFAERTRDASSRQAATRAADWLLARAIPRGPRAQVPGPSLEWPISAGDDERRAWWCHGGVGIALMYLRLFERGGDAGHADLARQALAAHPIEIRSSNLSQCHGLSGLVEASLEAARVLDEPVWIERASAVVSSMLDLARHHPGSALAWLVEDPFEPTADLMVGTGGVAHALLRFAYPQLAFGPPLMAGPVATTISAPRPRPRRTGAQEPIISLTAASADGFADS